MTTRETPLETPGAVLRHAGFVAKPSPGPWAINDHAACPVRDWTAVSIIDEEGPAGAVAYCHPLNAPLISAAHDLLEACKILVSWAKGNNLIGASNEPPGIDEAIAAIAKAKGAA